jgi:hypothetical protein
MAKGKKTGGRNFPEGVSGNPAGRPPLPPEVRNFKKLTREMVEEIGSIVLEADERALYAIATSSTTPALQKWIASAALNGIQVGDIDQLDKLLNRIIGKPIEKQQVTDALAGMTDEEKIKALEDALAFMKAKVSS